MEIVINVSDVLPQMAMVSGIIASKNVIPILDNFYFKAYENGKLEVMGSNNETWVSTQMEATEVNLDGVESQCFLIEAALLLSALKNLGNKQLSMVFEEEKKSVTCGYQNGVFTIPYSYADEYPLPAQVDGERLKIKATSLAYGIQKTKGAVSNDQLRPQMNGIHMDYQNGQMAFVATDAHRLALYRDHEVQFDGQVDMTIPLSASQIIENFTNKQEDDVEIIVSEVNTKFLFADGTMVVTRKLEGRYPNYLAVIPKEGTERCTLYKVETADAMKRTLVMGNQSVGLVVFDFDPYKKESFNVSTEDIDFSRSAQETVRCKDYDGAELKIGFKGAYMLSALATFDTEEVRLMMNGASRGAVMTPQGDDVDFLYLLMPTVVQGE